MFCILIFRFVFDESFHVCLREMTNETVKCLGCVAEENYLNNSQLNGNVVM